MLTLVGHGYVGNHIARHLATRRIVFAWVRHTDRIQPSGPIINAAGYTGFPNVDACEEHKDETFEGNVYWPIKLEEMAQSYPVVHITSGCVYNGFKEGGWSEEDEPNFADSHYSMTKALSQKALAPVLHKSYLLRMRMPFGIQNHPKNLLTKLTNYQKLIDGVNSLSRVEDVARVAVHFALKLPQPGIYNVVNPGGIKTREIVEIMGLKKHWFTEDEFRKSVKAPRSFCVLNSDKLQGVFPLDDVRTALRNCIVPETLAEPAVA